MLVLGSCDEMKLHRQLKEFSKREIIIPENMEQIGFADKIQTDYSDKSAIMVVYIDSIECATCRLQGMFQYDEMIDYATDSITGFVPAFIFSPRKSQLVDVRQLKCMV
jgi:ferredoxin-like protein FixX